MRELHYNGSLRIFIQDAIRSFDWDGSIINVKEFIDVISHSGLRFFIEPMDRILLRGDCASKRSVFIVSKGAKISSCPLFCDSNFDTNDFNSLTCFVSCAL